MERKYGMPRAGHASFAQRASIALRLAPALAAAALCLAPAAAEDGAADIIRKMDEAMTFTECSMRVSFEDLKASGASRTLGAEVWYAKSGGTLVAFVAPAREKGKRILMIGDSMWLGVPGVSKPVRLSGKDAFMGTSFTNDDVMNLDKSDDYDSSILASGPEGWTIELRARRKETACQRATIEVGRDYLPRSQRMFLLSGELSKTIEFSEPRLFGAKRRPSVFKVVDAMTKGASTTIRFESIEEGAVDRARLSPATFMK